MADLQLPEDVLVEILIRLPVKSIVKLRCVSKTWRDLIKSRMFIRRHQNHERKQSILLVKRYLAQGSGDDAILSFHDPDFPELLVSPNQSILFLKDLKNPPVIYLDVKIYGPCNGLVCIPLVDVWSKYMLLSTVFLCNPALREFKPLPRLSIPCPMGYNSCPVEFGFGFDPNTGAYKVIQISQIFPREYEELLRTQDVHHRIDVYNSASNSWKHIDTEVPGIYQSRSFHVFFRGVLHWFAGSTFPDPYMYIFCFNVTTEAYQSLDVPDDFPKSELQPALMVLKENLVLVGYPWGQSNEPREMLIWVMKEYGVKESWTKQIVIGPYMVVCPLLFLNDEWLLVESNDGQLAVCALEANQLKRFPICRGIMTTLSAVVFEESLISLNDIIVSENE